MGGGGGGGGYYSPEFQFWPRFIFAVRHTCLVTVPVPTSLSASELLLYFS